MKIVTMFIVAVMLSGCVFVARPVPVRGPVVIVHPRPMHPMR